MIKFQILFLCRLTHLNIVNLCKIPEKNVIFRNILKVINLTK